MSPFIPLNEFERVLHAAQQGRATVPDLLRAFAAADLMVPSASEVRADGSGLEPIALNPGAASRVACFSDPGRIDSFAQIAPYAVRMKGIDLLRWLPAELGLIVNPGHEVGFELPAQGVANALRDFG